MHDIPIVNAMNIVFFTLGPTIFIPVAQAVFLNRFLPQMRAIDPALTEAEIMQAGATRLKELVQESERPKVSLAYAKSLDMVFVVAAVLAAVSAFIALGVEWRSIKKGEKRRPLE
jgi:hypothetical protein